MVFCPVKTVLTKSSNTAASVTTSGITTTTGDLLVVAITCFGNHIGATPVTDSLSNTWTAAISSTGTTKGWGAIFYCANCTGGTGHTFTFTPSSSDFIAIGVLAIQGAATSSVLGSTATSTASGTTHTAGSITSGVTQEILVGAGALSASAEGTPGVADGRWYDANLVAGATSEGIVLAWRLVDPNTTDSFVYTTSNTQNETVMIAGFKCSTGPTPVGHSLLATRASTY